MIFCTLFDSNYLSRGLALLRSLGRHLEDFHLYAFAADPRCHDVLASIDDDRLTVLSLSEVEGPELLAVKPGRSRGEYLWTCTTSTILYVMDHFDVDHCTYVDADLYFLDSPKVLFEELGDDSILITSHRFSPRYRKLIKYGKYCVQYMTFKKDDRGLEALRWWRDACIEWCFARREDGKFGDQKYLDDWPERFAGVHELRHLGGGVAPWNVQQYEVFEEGGRVCVREANASDSFPIVFYHFHSLKLLPRERVDLGLYRFPPEAQELLYAPYLRTLLEIGREVRSRFPELDPHGLGTSPISWKTPLIAAQRALTGSYQVYPLAQICRL